MNWTWSAILPSHTIVGSVPGGRCRANENLNGLVRQYFPKEISFDWITEQRINEVWTS